VPGHITRRRFANGTTRWRARHPNPLKGGTAQTERLFTTRRGAEDWLDSLRHATKFGTYIDPRGADRTLSAIADEWWGTWTDLEPKTKAGYESILKGHVLPEFGRARIGAITPSAIQAFVNELGVTRAQNTVRRIYTVLRSVLGLAAERRYIAANPAAGVRLPKKGVRRVQIVPLRHEERVG
jgi:hypothetical protein